MLETFTWESDKFNYIIVPDHFLFLNKKCKCILYHDVRSIWHDGHYCLSVHIPVNAQLCNYLFEHLQQKLNISLAVCFTAPKESFNKDPSFISTQYFMKPRSRTSLIYTWSIGFVLLVNLYDGSLTLLCNRAEQFPLDNSA